MKVVPEDVFTVPLEGASKEPQSTAVGRCLIKRHELMTCMDNCTTYVNNLVQAPTFH